MNESFLSGLAIVAICLFVSAFFSLTETTVTSISNLKAKHIKENHPQSGKLLNLWLDHPHRVLAAVLIGNNLVNIFASVYMDQLIFKTFGQSHLELVTAAMTIIIVVFCEIIPKTLAKTFSSDIVLPVLGIFRFVYILLLPATKLLSGVTKLIDWIVSKSGRSSSPEITSEELEFLIDESGAQGVLHEQKHEMLSGVFELGDTVVREIMIHRTDIVCLPISATVLDAVQLFKKSGLSRIPLFVDRIDNIGGILHAKDVMFSIKKESKANADPWHQTVDLLKRDAFFVPESKSVEELFQELRKHRQHMAIVLDEYGGTGGLVTMEDIIEEIVGEVRDEFDQEEDAIRPTAISNKYVVDCKIHFEDFCDFFDISLNSVVENETDVPFDTLGGLILEHFGKVPKAGDTMKLEHVEIVVAEVSKRRVRRITATNTLTIAQPKAPISQPPLEDTTQLSSSSSSSSS
jgi:putative hemolysin